MDTYYPGDRYFLIPLTRAQQIARDLADLLS